MGDERADGGTENVREQTARRPQWAQPSPGDFGWRGWTLVGVIVLSFLVIPIAMIAIAHRPSIVGSFGMTFQDAYLTLPMIPAILLALTAVWAGLHARRR